MITVHHLEYSQSFRILWLMEELGVAYDVKLYERDPKTRLAPAAYKALSPLGTAPVITDGDLVLSETNAVVDYILDKHDKGGTLRPRTNSKMRQRYLFWFHAAQGSMMPLLLFHSIFGILTTRVPGLIRPLIRSVLERAKDGFVRPRMAALLDVAEKDLADGPWFAGTKLTAADIVMCYGMEAAHKSGYITDQHVNCQAWLKQMHADPAFQTALKKDGRESIIFSG